jgi:hypothetical protein
MNSFLLLVAVISPPQYECVRWTWTGDVYNRTVICLEWREKNSSTKK